jgi:hypothetical protein
MIEFPIDRPRAVDPLACLIRPVRLYRIFLSNGNASHPEREHAW